MSSVENNLLRIVIPALSKHAVFQDDLIKKHAGQSLVQRAISKARSSGLTEQNILVVTDLDEACLVAERNGAQPIYQVGESVDLFDVLRQYLTQVADDQFNESDFLFLSPYAPSITSEELVEAYRAFVSERIEVLRPVRQESHRIFVERVRGLDELAMAAPDKSLTLDSLAFLIFKGRLLQDSSSPLKVTPWTLQNQVVEIETLQDWWVSEKLLQRRCIVFRVIGNEEVGMGHIYRSLTLAHELSDHEVIFVCDSESYGVVNQLAGYDYRLGVVPERDIVSAILDLKPDLVINDVLDTTAEYIRSLKESDVLVVDFEDLGSGAAMADLTINELYDEPVLEGENILWGHRYFFVREEFEAARPHQLTEKVASILLTFGGTDKNELTLAIYKAIRDLCRRLGVKIHIVTGPGYLGYQKLADEVANNDGASVTHATGVMSRIMEQTAIAITSNGRTVYELAHMNIPSIVIPQHERECTHSFASEATGFLPMLPYREQVSETEIRECLEKLLTDYDFRAQLMKNISPYSFESNKKEVLSKIISLFEDV